MDLLWNRNMSLVPDDVAGSGAVTDAVAGFATIDAGETTAGVGVGVGGVGFAGAAADLAAVFAGSGVVRNVEMYSRTGGPKEVDSSEVRAGGLMVGVLAPRSPGVTADVGA